MAQPRIFVRIASYRDRECGPTILELFRKAARPERVFVGVCLQYAPDRDSPNLDLGRWSSQVRMLRVRSATSRGVCWARAQAERLWRGEEFSLQVDSHSRFAPGYDETLLEMLGQCPSDKAVLSSSPAAYAPPNQLEENPAVTIRICQNFDPWGGLRFVGRRLVEAPATPVRGAFVAGGMIFSDSRILAEVPYDPSLYFEQEEIAYALRLFTHGWDVYAPHRVTTYHFYRKAGSVNRPCHWKDDPEWRSLHERGQRRLETLWKGGAEARKIRDFGLGEVRSVAEYEVFTGICFGEGRVGEPALSGGFDGALPALQGALPSVDADVPAPAQASELRLGQQDVVPFFRVSDANGQQQATQTLGGAWTVLVTLARWDEAEVRHLAEAFAQARFDGRTGRVVALVAGSSPEVAGIVGAGALAHAFWCDPSGTWVGLFGDSREPRVHLLCPNLRISRTFEGSSLREHLRAAWAQLVTRSRARRLSGPSRSHAPVLQVPNALSEEERRQLLEMFELGRSFPGRVGPNGGRYAPDLKVRRDVILGPEACRFVDERLARRVFPEMEKVFATEVLYREPYKLACYDAADSGFFDRHRDNLTAELRYRSFAVSLNLDGGYEGGEVAFPEYEGGVYRPAPGDALVFSCSLLHEARPVRRGRRRILLGFLSGERARQQLAALGREGRYRLEVPRVSHGLLRPD